MTEPIRYELSDGVSTITLDDGKANALSPAMLMALGDALDRAEADKSVVLIAGRQGFLSAGFDLNVLKSGTSSQATDMLVAGARLTERLLSFPAPVMIACTGHAIAMGAFLLLSADVRIGIASGPFRICVNEVQIGMTLPRFAIEVCRQRLAPAHFNRALLTAEPYDPQQAVAAGFLDDVVAESQLLASARSRALGLSKLVREAHVATKRRVRQATLSALRQAIEMDCEDWAARSRSGA
jgi:enoyl-CoA hydratase